MYIKPEDELDLYRKIDDNAAINSMITGCNMKMLRTGGRPRDMGNGITWYDSDRPGMKKVLKNWGITFKRLHWFDFPGIYMMATGIKRPEGEYGEQLKLGSAFGIAMVVVGIAVLYTSFS